MMFRTIEWLDDSSEVRLVDQTKLPLTLEHVVTDSHERIAKSIKIMEIRGAPAIGAAAGMGMALAAKMNREHYFTFVLLGDGELYEGSIWESAMLANHHHLNNLIAIVDRNWQCATAFTENCVRLEPLDEKWKAFGWDVINIDGHSIREILTALHGFRCEKRNKPLVIIADTVKGKGVSFMETEVLWHSLAPKGEQAIQAKKELQL